MLSQKESRIEIRKELRTLFSLIKDQWVDCKQAFIANDTNSSEKILEEERKVNALEIRIDQSCEKYLALHTPVAIDLRFVLSTLKINTYLERIGDNIEGIANATLALNKVVDVEVRQFFEIDEIFEALDLMLDKAEVALFEEDAEVAREVKAFDSTINKIDKSNRDKAEEFLSSPNGNVKELLHILFQD